LFEQGDEQTLIPNMSSNAAEYIAHLDLTARELFDHIVATLHAPMYRTENAGALRQDWPRIPLPASRDALMTSAQLGREVAALLDANRAVPGVTSGRSRPELRVLARITREGDGSLSSAAGDLAITAGWGYAGNGGAIMPGQGKVNEREYTPDELQAIHRGAEGFGLPAEQVLQLLGETTYDVYLNAVAYWRNIPANVWGYTLGGYQVLKKWLSYREHKLLHRPLHLDEAREVTTIACRIAAILLLEPALDANYRDITSSTAL
jgi:Type ISP C-terminal specificity domain